MKRFLTEALFIVLAVAIVALIVLHQVDKVSKRVHAQIEAKKVAETVQVGGQR